MGEHLNIERYYWFDGEVRNGRYPNAASMARHFEISTKTAQRAIEFMRDRFKAPLDYESSHKGYYYTDQTFALPGFQVAQEELLALLLARTLLAQSADGLLSRAIHAFGRKLLTAVGGSALNPARLEDAFSATWTGYAPVSGETFRVVVDALLQERVLTFAYRSPGANGEMRRQVEPHHLQHYMGSWVLIAWCRKRGDWRKFFLSRLQQPALEEATFTLRPRRQWQELIASAFGIFQGGELTTVTLRFTPFRAPWIREQLWHPEQRLVALPDGGLELSLPVADFREIKLKILQYGRDVEVVAPEGLRREIGEEIAAMGRLYQAAGSSR